MSESEGNWSYGIKRVADSSTPASGGRSGTVQNRCFPSGKPSSIRQPSSCPLLLKEKDNSPMSDGSVLPRPARPKKSARNWNPPTCKRPQPSGQSAGTRCFDSARHATGGDPLTASGCFVASVSSIFRSACWEDILLLETLSFLEVNTMADPENEWCFWGNVSTHPWCEVKLFAQLPDGSGLMFAEVGR